MLTIKARLDLNIQTDFSQEISREICSNSVYEFEKIDANESGKGIRLWGLFRCHGLL